MLSALFSNVQKNHLCGIFHIWDKSDENVGNLTKRQAQILSLMEEGKEYTTESIAAVIELKGPRTRQLMNELVELGKIESIGTTKDRRYKKISQ